MYHCDTSSNGPFLDPLSNPGLIKKRSNVSTSDIKKQRYALAPIQEK